MGEAIRQLGRYELVRRIAVGGMGEIYLARMRGAAGFEKRVIIKTILPHLAEEEEFVEKFLDEGRIVVQLTHGNIVPVFDMGQQDGEYFIAMEYLPGRDLREIIKRLQVDRARMPVGLAVLVVMEVCKGLAYAHRKLDQQGAPLGLVHRDVSPSNILVSREGDVRIIDFGIARATGRSQRTASGRIQGKFSYMSPEQASGKPLDPRSDIFSTGIVLYELLTGMRPFDGDSDLETLDRVRAGVCDPITTLRPELPEALDAIIARAMAPDPADRFPSIDRLQVELGQCLYGLGETPTGPDLSHFLQELFPEGLERDELRATGSGSGPVAGKRLSLDDALDMELERLDALDARPRTPSDRGLFTATQGPLTRTATQAPATPVAPSAPLAEQTPVEPAGSPTDPTPLVIATPQVEPAIAQPAAPPAMPRGTKRLVAGVAIAVLLAVALGGVVAERLSAEERGMLRVESEPRDALIYVDGERLGDRLTPTTLELEVGPHEIVLRRDGFEPRTFRVEVAPGTAKQNDPILASEATLAPVKPAEPDLGQPQPPARRSFLIESEPSGAEVFAYTESTPRGTTPLKLELATMEVVPLRFRKEGCEETSNISLSSTQPAESVRVKLDCAPPDPVDAVDPIIKRPAQRTIALRFASEPATAQLTINGRKVEQGYSAHFAPELALTVRAELAGWEPAELRGKASSMQSGKVLLTLRKVEQGCVDVRIHPPSRAELSFDGGAWEVAEFALKGRKLNAGEHRVRARNLEAKREESHSFRVEPGAGCANVQVFER
jgi:eukaryotic-like serine/threonine-protein kinase